MIQREAWCREAVMEEDYRRLLREYTPGDKESLKRIAHLAERLSLTIPWEIMVTLSRKDHLSLPLEVRPGLTQTVVREWTDGAGIRIKRESASAIVSRNGSDPRYVQILWRRMVLMRDPIEVLPDGGIVNHKSEITEWSSTGGLRLMEEEIDPEGPTETEMEMWTAEMDEWLRNWGQIFFKVIYYYTATNDPSVSAKEVGEAVLRWTEKAPQK